MFTSLIETPKRDVRDYKELAEIAARGRGGQFLLSASLSSRCFYRVHAEQTHRQPWAMPRALRRKRPSARCKSCETEGQFGREGRYSDQATRQRQQ